jgi:hypothetical protein
MQKLNKQLQFTKKMIQQNLETRVEGKVSEPVELDLYYAGRYKNCIPSIIYISGIILWFESY